ncbi:MAG TPA: phospholipid carrier-dependent glycosyltransferase [Jatrophihabitans sp.]|nr:phospholipid carrier-dependent glycosyltransferase [Jatrophihabitans sp.]
MTTATLPSAEAAPAVPPPELTGRPLPAGLRTWQPGSWWTGWGWTLLVTAVAGVIRFWALGFPPGKSFDEIYYATEAQEMLRYGYEDNRGYMFIVHPPLGKWLIALGSAVFGNNSLGWRVVPALAGTLCVALLARVAMRMFHSVILGVLAGALLAMEGISVVISRVALLDIFLQFFILAGFVALVIDRDRLRQRLAGLYLAGVDLSSGVPPLGPRPWRLAGGVLLGLAFGVKWSALSFWGAFALLSILWDRGAFKSAGVEQPWLAVLKRSFIPWGFSLGASPAAAYLLSWTGWFVGENSWNRHWGDTHPGTGLFRFLPSGLRSLLDYHHQAYLFHTHLFDPHPYKANPWSWLILGRPISFYAPADVTGCGAANCTREILCIGTPIMYWAFVPALLWLAWHWATTRDWRAGAVWMAFFAGWGVWLQNQRRTGFLFYMTPLMPYLILGVTLAVGMLLSRTAAERAMGTAQLTSHPESDEVRSVGIREWIAVQGISRHYLLRLALVTLWLGAVVADFVWMWPLFTGGMLTNAQWHLRMWFPSWI